MGSNEFFRAHWNSKGFTEARFGVIKVEKFMVAHYDRKWFIKALWGSLELTGTQKVFAETHWGQIVHRHMRGTLGSTGTQ